MSINRDSGAVIVQATTLFYQRTLPKKNQHHQTAERGHVDKFQNIVRPSLPPF